MFHAQEFKLKVDQMPIEEHIKEAMVAQVENFMAKLFEVSNFDPKSDSVSKEAPQFMSEVRLARD